MTGEFCWILMSGDASVLSVIVPTYNRSQMVCNCVRSLQQCGLSKLQVIVVDDGSTDDTEARVRSLGGNVLYLRQQNQGPAAARNLGFQHSVGRYVAFVDDDDQWLPEAARIPDLLDRYPEVDAIFGDALVDRPGEPLYSGLRSPANVSLLSVAHRQPEPKFRIFEKRAFFCHLLQRNSVFISATIMRRDAFARAGMFDAVLRGAADWDLWLRIAHCMNFACWSEALAVYLQHGGAMSRQQQHMRQDEWKTLRKCRERLALDRGLEAKILRRGLRTALHADADAHWERKAYHQARAALQMLLRECGFEMRYYCYSLLCALPVGFLEATRRIKHKLCG